MTRNFPRAQLRGTARYRRGKRHTRGCEIFAESLRVFEPRQPVLATGSANTSQLTGQIGTTRDHYVRTLGIDLITGRPGVEGSDTMPVEGHRRAPGRGPRQRRQVVTKAGQAALLPNAFEATTAPPWPEQYESWEQKQPQTRDCLGCGRVWLAPQRLHSPADGDRRPARVQQRLLTSQDRGKKIELLLHVSRPSALVAAKGVDGDLLRARVVVERSEYR